MWWHNVESYPTKVTKTATTSNALTTRACSSGKLKESGKTVLTQSTLINDAIKAWNLAPKEIHESLSYNIAKKTLKCLQKHYQSKLSEQILHSYFYTIVNIKAFVLKIVVK